MRYKEKGQVHKDFHLCTDTTIKFILRKYGKGFLKSLFERTAQRVYKDIYKHLKRGNVKPLLEHWKYYFNREKGKYKVIKYADNITFSVKSCPAVNHIKNKGIKFSPCFCLQTSLMNEGWSKGTPFKIVTQKVKDNSCRQIIRKK